MKRFSTISCVLILSHAFVSAIDTNKPSVLVTGGAGYIGSHVALVMSQHDYEVFVIDRKIKKQFPWAHCIQADYADEAEDYYHTTIQTNILPKRSADSPKLISDYSKAYNVLGWEPRYSTLQNIIASADQYDTMQNVKE